MKSANPAIDFAYLIMICKLYKTKQSKKTNKTNQNEQEVWSNAEEEIFNEVCNLKKKLHLKSNFNGTFCELLMCFRKQNTNLNFV